MCLVDLDAGARMVVVEQNQRTGTAALAGLRGKPVHLSWHDEHVIEIPSREDSDAAHR